jgi:hypothetical protein
LDISYQSELGGKNMICPNCQVTNEADNVFCVNCGTTVSQALNLSPNSIPPTQIFQNAARAQHYNTSNSIETAVLPVNPHNPSIPNFAPSAAYTGDRKTARSKNIVLLVGSFLVVFLLIGLGGLYFLTKNPTSAEILPEHLGMFVQSREKDKVSEVKKQDFTNAFEGAEKLLKDDTLVAAEEKPNLILYSDGKDVPLNDLRLIRLDTIKSDGNLKQLDFQAAPIENKPEMKRIRIPDGLANGKYAFAVLDGYLDEGKHKFWAFEVKNASKSNSDSDLKSTTVSIKPKQQNTATNSANPAVPQMPKTIVPPPPGATVAHLALGNVVLRSGPSQTSAAIGKLSGGQTVYIIGYSDTYETFTSQKTGQTYNSNYAQVQTESGRRGWIFRAFLK